MLVVFDSLVKLESYKMPVNEQHYQDYEINLAESEFSFIDIFGKFTDINLGLLVKLHAC
jgi:hypothetical protein